MPKPSWLRALLPRTSAPVTRTTRAARLTVENLEERAVPANFTVDRIGDTNSGAGTSGDLRFVLALAANDNSDDTITFATPLFNSAQTISLALGQLDLSKGSGHTGSITVQGTGANLLSIKSNGSSRVFYLNTSGTATLSGLTLTGGIATNGAGVLNKGSLALISAIVSGNSATQLGGGVYNSGGGMANANGSVTLMNTTITGNSAALGGGVLNTSGGSATLTNTTIAGNSATLGGG